jgi:hypothetical protein
MPPVLVAAAVCLLGKEGTVELLVKLAPPQWAFEFALGLFTEVLPGLGDAVCHGKLV